MANAVFWAIAYYRHSRKRGNDDRVSGHFHGERCSMVGYREPFGPFGTENQTLVQMSLPTILA